MTQNYPEQLLAMRQRVMGLRDDALNDKSRVVFNDNNSLPTRGQRDWEASYVMVTPTGKKGVPGEGPMTEVYGFHMRQPRHLYGIAIEAPVSRKFTSDEIEAQRYPTPAGWLDDDGLRQTSMSSFMTSKSAAPGAPRVG